MLEDKRTPAAEVLDLVEELNRRLEQVERQLNQADDVFPFEEPVRSRGESEDTAAGHRNPRHRSAITQTALEKTGVVVLVVDPVGMIVHVDGAVEELTGFAAGNVLGKSIWDTVVPEEEVVHVQLVFAELESGRRRNRHEYTVVSHDGQRSLISWSNSAILDATSSVKYIVSAGIDIAERCEQEPSSRTESERYRRLIESSPDVIWEYKFSGLTEAAERIARGETSLERVCDPLRPEVEMHAVFVSPAVKQLLGFTPEEMLTRSLQQHLTPRSFEHCYQVLARHLEQELAGVQTEPVVLELEEFHKSGKIIWTRSNVQLTRDERGFPTGLAGISSDIMREKQAERALQESLEQFRMLVESTPTAILVHTRGRLVYANPGAARLFRVESPAQLVGRAVFDLVHPDSLEQAKQRTCEVLRNLTVAPIQELTLLRADGSAFVAEIVAVPITYDGEPSVQAVFADLSERKRIQEQERRLDEIRTRLDQLSPRESEVLRFVIAGKPNKVIASRLGISIKTVEHHRSNVMKKTQANSVADLVRITLLSGWSPDLNSQDEAPFEK